MDRETAQKSCCRGMMKTLCVAVVVLSLTSVCRPASLACDKLLKPQDKSADLAGRWYTIGISMDSCLISVLMTTLDMSVEVNIVSKDTPNVYNADFKIKVYGYCSNESDPFFLGNNSIFNIDINNAPTGEPDVLLQSGCPDCIVVKGDDSVNTLLLFSRRKTITAAELKEFETQAECLRWSKPYFFSSDHDYTNCTSLDGDDADTDVDTSRLWSLFYERLKNKQSEALKCLTEYPNAVFEWVKQAWTNLW